MYFPSSGKDFLSNEFYFPYDKNLAMDNEVMQNDDNFKCYSSFETYQNISKEIFFR